MKKQQENYLKLLLGLLSMTFLIYIGSASLEPVRFDITEEGLFTLSKGSKSILSKLDSPIRLKLYYSKTAANKGTEGLRAFNNYFLYVKELLRQYESHSRNNLSLQIIDPRPDTPEEEDALAYGLKRFNLTETEKYFFGLVAVNEAGAEKIIEFFDPNQKEKLEYDLSKLIYTVLNPQKKTVGILSSLNILSEDMSPYVTQLMRMQGKNVNDSWVVIQMLKEFYNLKKVNQIEEKITGIDTLVIIHPRGFSEKTLFSIDQYLLAGGRILVFVDPNAVSDQGSAMMGGASASPDAAFRKLMDKWGIELIPNAFAGDKYLSGIGSSAPGGPPSRLLAIMNCTAECTNKFKDNISSGINKTTLVFPGVLKSKKIEGVEHTPLFSTTDRGNSYSVPPFQANNPQAVWNSFSEGTEPVILAYRAVGKFQTAYPDGPPDEKVEKKKKSKDKKEIFLRKSSKESAIIVFSDTDFLSDRFAFQKTFLGLAAANDNSTLFLNSVESLSGDVDLISVRSKGRVNRSFDVINSIEIGAEKRTMSKVKEINANIGRFQAELSQLGRKANAGNIALLQNEGIRKKKDLSKKIAVLKRELRAVKREGREKIELIGKFFQYFNTLFVPLLIIILGVYYSRKRGKLMSKRKNALRDSSSGPTGASNLAKVNV